MSEVFALSLIAGFLHGHDSIDDQIEFDRDPGIESALGETPKARAMGDWLRTQGIEPQFMSWAEREAQSQEPNQD